jgi:hypothetical protein
LPKNCPGEIQRGCAQVADVNINAPAAYDGREARQAVLLMDGLYRCLIRSEDFYVPLDAPIVRVRAKRLK